MNFFLEVLIGGLLSGVMYALVALGFVMIYKASGVFNFAQGAMVYLAALSVVGCMEKGAPLWLAIILAFAIMTAFGIATEKFVLRKLVLQPLKVVVDFVSIGHTAHVFQYLKLGKGLSSQFSQFLECLLERRQFLVDGYICHDHTVLGAISCDENTTSVASKYRLGRPASLAARPVV